MDAHRARKRFGQNFLTDAGIIQRIVEAIAPQPQDRLVEIGPGQAALTRPLLERCPGLLAIEIDRDLVARLQRQLPTLTLMQADALTVDYAALRGDGAALRLAGNLPYNISSPLLFHLLESLHAIQDMHFMLQWEVVERMAAGPGGRERGRLGVMLQARCAVEPLFRVPPHCFDPMPKVESAIVRLTPLPKQPGAAQLAALEQLVRNGFAQRRKTLANALRGLDGTALLTRCGIDPGRRAESLSQQEWLQLAEASTGS